MIGKVDSYIEGVGILKKNGLVELVKTSKYSRESLGKKETIITSGFLFKAISLDAARGVIPSNEQVNSYQIVTKNSIQKSEVIVVEENRTITCSFK